MAKVHQLLVFVVLALNQVVLALEKKRWDTRASSTRNQKQGPTKLPDEPCKRSFSVKSTK